MKTGLKKYNVESSNDKSKSQLKENKFKQYKYTSGWTAIAFITILFIAISLFGIYVTKLVWFHSLSIASAICFCLNLVWLILRQKFNKKMRWTFLKYYKKLKLDNIVFFGSQHKEDYAYYHVDNEEEFSDFLDEKVKRSTLAFWISFSFYAIVLIVFILISIFLK